MLEIIGLNDENKWYDIVKQFKEHDVYYLPQYTKAFAIHGDGEPLLFYYESEDTKAINVVMKRDIAACGYFAQDIRTDTLFDIVTPYGYGGFLTEGSKDERALEKLNKEYSAYCKGHGIVSEFVRFHPLLENHIGMETVYEIRQLGRAISMDLSSPEVIHSNIKPSTRNKIRKAKSHGIKILCGNTWDLYMAFKELYDETMDRNKADSYYYFSESFYKSIMEDLLENAKVCYATQGEDIIAIEIVLCCNGRMYSHLQASKKEYMHLAPVALMNYESAMMGYEKGMNVFYLGGGVGSKEDSLYEYKSNFNRRSENRFVTGRKIFDQEKYTDLQNIREKNSSFDASTDFFPVYRA